MNRRDLLGLLGTAIVWPRPARPQQPAQVRQMGVLMSVAAEDPEGPIRIAALRQELQGLGWVDRRNLRINIRWSGGNVDDFRKYAAEMVALAPDVILSAGSVTLGPLLQVTRTIPIVFVHVPDPVGAGFVESLARPGGNATGFINFEYGLSAKWLELLKEIAPNVTRVAVIRDPSLAVGLGQLGAIQSVAPSFRVEVKPISVRDTDEIGRAITEFARSPGGGLIVTASALAAAHREVIVALTGQHKLPAVYSEPYTVRAGGLISYGPELIEQYRQAARYIDRILKGERPADLPVQQPTKFELVINVKTAKALGLTVPHSMLARADEVIE